MCGIAGIISLNKQPIDKQRLVRMTDIIEHRGPDGDGHWLNNTSTVALGHRRLSIIDLSHEADQPMHYQDRYTIIFNGEIYNYIELKETLLKKGYKFKTASDTEVLMAMYQEYGTNCLDYLDGMFAFVLYDSKENKIFGARDRFGEKPFYYNYEPGKHFLFGSEMKCLWAAGLDKKTDPVMIYNYMTQGYLDDAKNPTRTFYANCIKLLHSHYFTLDLNTENLQIKKYWDINTHSDSQYKLSTAIEEFNELFTTSVARRLRSDVTVGSSLSGGLDSSLVVCIINELKKGTAQKQNTFSAVFPGFAKDERKYMDYVINSTHVHPHFCTPDAAGFMADYDKLVWHQEEPFGSTSIYAQYCVNKLAKQNNTTVLLDGQGADEILAGYHPYYLTYFNELKATNNEAYKNQLEIYTNLHKHNAINGLIQNRPIDRIKKLIPFAVKPLRYIKNSLQQSKDPFLSKEFYQSYKGNLLDNSNNAFDTLNNHLYDHTINGPLQILLRYADRNSMANSREVRLPFLSHELVEFLFKLPPTFKINEGWTKWIMRETFPILPKEIGWRKDKIGYEPPQKDWLSSNTMQDKINDSKALLVKEKILHPSMLNKTNIAAAAHEKNPSWVVLMAAAYYK
jgi:asparagine synthase (glutamine-hydrolysing)